MLISLSRAFDQDAIDTLLFLKECGGSGWSQGDHRKLILSPDAVFAHRRLIVAELVDYWKPSPHSHDGYLLYLTPKGEAVVEAWRNGDKKKLARALLPEEMEDN